MVHLVLSEVQLQNAQDGPSGGCFRPVDSGGYGHSSGVATSTDRQLFLTEAKVRMSLTMPLPEAPTQRDVVIEIGGLPIEVQTTDPEFERILRGRYRDYIRPEVAPEFALRVQVTTPDMTDPDADAEVWLEDREWKMVRGDFRATWNPEERRGQVTQSANPYSIDSVRPGARCSAAARRAASSASACVGKLSE